jgi:hypothetical protein
VVWGLNLFGSNGFCMNPRFGNDPASSLRHALHNWPAGSDEVIKRNYDELWTAYSAVGGVWDPKKFSSLVRAMLLPSASDPEVMASLAERLAITFLQRATQARDPFRSVEVAATLAVALLPALEHQLVADTAERLLDNVALSLVSATAALVKDLDSDKYALLSDRSGVLSELHELPIRVTKVLGWSAAATAISPNSTLRAEAEALYGRLTRLILAHYSGSVTSFSDAQAAGFCVALSTCTKLGLRDEGEQLAGLLFNSLIQCEGKVARGDLPRDRALDYLVARRQNDYSDLMDLVARPVDLLTVLLKAAVHLDLEDVFDESLWKIDGLAFSAYMPSDYVKFGDRLMEGGENLVWLIGYDVFKTADFVASWPAPKTSPQTPLVASLAIAASLLYPDRQAWFLLER